jgi:hypothetical protein
VQQANMKSALRSAAVLFALLFSWFAMQAVHELGHVLAAWATGGTVERVVLHPLTISRTDVSPNPRPLIVAWAGPIVGVLIPLSMAALCRLIRKGPRHFCDFFAGFCLIANGAYIGAGSLAAIGDAGELIRHGAPQWTLIGFGIVTAGYGLWIWHCLTKRSPKQASMQRE